MFWYQNVQESVLSKNLLYDTLSPLSILKNPRWRPGWPPDSFNLLLTLCMTYKNTYNLHKSQALAIFFNFIVSASSFEKKYEKLFFLYFKRQKYCRNWYFNDIFISILKCICLEKVLYIVQLLYIVFQNILIPKQCMRTPMLDTPSCCRAKGSLFSVQMNQLSLFFNSIG